MKRLLRWYRSFPRCYVDGKRIWAHGPYSLCRKHEREGMS